MGEALSKGDGVIVADEVDVVLECPAKIVIR